MAMVKPLDKRYAVVTDDKLQEEVQIPCLHPARKEDIQFVLYEPPPLDPTRGAEYEEWQERLSFIEDDLHHLLKLPHDKFWCQVVFDDTLNTCIDSYLKHAPRCYDTVFSLPPAAKDRHDKLHKLFFLVCLRMTTHKESKENYITPEVFGEILYENFIFDIPKLMDLCVLYGANNGPILSKMIHNVFSQQPKYEQDLAAIVPTVLEVFTNIESKCGIKSGSTPSSPQKLDAAIHNEQSLVSMETRDFQDILFYLSDTAHTLWAFLDVYPEGARAFHQGDFTPRLVASYEALVSVLNEAFKERSWPEGGAVKARLKKKLHQAQLCLLKVFRQMVFQAYLQPILDNSSSVEVEHYIEGFLNMMTSILHEKRFLAHCEVLHPFREDRELLGQSQYAVDDTRLQFIQDGVNDAYGSYGRRHNSPREAKAGHHGNADPGNLDNQMTWAGAPRLPPEVFQTENYEEPLEGATAARVTGVELDSLISTVKDILMDLGEGFIELCLEEMGYDTEKVISMILEEKLPPSLEGLDRTMPRRPQPAQEEEPSMLSQRANIFDDDEFDVFSKDKVDTSKIHQGKKEKAQMSELEDKSTVDELKPLYQKYGSEFVESMYDNNIEYEDEYDDTYDSNLIGADDVDSADELTAKRLQIFAAAEEEEEKEEYYEDQDKCARRNLDQFIEDPAKIREKQAQRWAETQAQRSKGQGHGGGGAKPRDLKGAPKGQGQSSEVLRNRAYKEKNKSSRRKAQADKKRQF